MYHSWHLDFIQFQNEVQEILLRQARIIAYQRRLSIFSIRKNQQKENINYKNPHILLSDIFIKIQRIQRENPKKVSLQAFLKLSIFQYFEKIEINKKIGQVVKKHHRLQYNYQQQVQTMKNQQQFPNHTYLTDQRQQKQDLECLLKTQNESTSHYYQYLENGFRTFTFQTLISQLKQHQIDYHPYESYDRFSLHLVRYSTNLRVITVRVCLGPFSTELIIYNSPEESFTHPLNCINGTCSNVYFLKSSEKNVAIKCIQPQQSYTAAALRVIREYFINRIASALKVGPKLFKVSQQFDLIFYSGCIQFSMQKCDFTEQYTFSQQHQNKLKQSLLKLHTLNIVHCDIKAANIVYSVSYGSLVFIDFGFSKILPTKQGTKRKMKFVGSLQTCCKEMMELYVSKEYGYIDLYDNDSFSLRATIKGDLTQQTGHDLDDIMRQRNVIEPYDLLKIFNLLYNDRHFNAKVLYLQSQRSDKKIKTMEFISLLPPTESLREFYMRILKHEWQDSINFAQTNNRLCHSYKHSLKLHHKLMQQHIEEGKISSVRIIDMHKFIQNTFSTQISLQDLENDQIDQQEEIIGMKNFLNTTKNFTQRYYDFYLSKIGIINHISLNNQSKQKNYQIISNHFYDKNVSSDNEACYQMKDKVLKSFEFLKDFSFSNPPSKLKQRIFHKVICQLLLLKQVQFVYIQKVIKQITHSKFSLAQKMDLILALIKGIIFQIAIWGNFFQKQEKSNQLSTSIEDLQVRFLQLGFDKSLQKVIRFDLFVLINLVKKQRTSDCIQLMKNSMKYLRQGQISARVQFINFIEFMYLYEKKMYQECRMRIEASLAQVQIPVIIKAEYFILCNIYLRLKNMDRCKKLYNFIKENIIFKDILYCSQLFLISLDLSDATQLQNIIRSKSKPQFFLPIILNKYFKTDKKQKNKISAYRNIIYQITNDSELMEYLKKLQIRDTDTKDKGYIMNKLIQYLKNPIFIDELSKNQERAVVNYIFTSQIQILWINDSYGKIIDILQTNKNPKINQICPCEYYPHIFDFIIRVYFAQNEIQKMNIRIKSFIQPSKFMQSLQEWIITLSFKILFKINMQKYDWQQFKEFLIPILQFIDIHHVKQYVNSYCEAIRYSFHGEINLIGIDQGLKVLSYQNFQWKFPLISFLHIQAIIRMSHILNKKQLKIYLFKLTAFFPFLKVSEQKWILQEYYHLALKFYEKKRYQKYLGLKCRKYINYMPKLKKNNYSISRLVVDEKTCLNQFLVQKYISKSVAFSLGEKILLGNSNSSKIFGYFQNRLKSYHRIAGNLSIPIKINSWREIMRLKLS